jgi:hypothetical protein
MGLFMVVQELKQNEKPIEIIKIPKRIPREIIENDSLLTVESNLNKLEDKLVITARSVLSLTNEMKIQLYEIERLEKTILNMHEYMVSQNFRIDDLEKQIEETQSQEDDQGIIKGLWSRLFSK